MVKKKTNIRIPEKSPSSPHIRVPGSLTPQSPPEPAGPYFFEQIEIF